MSNGFSISIPKSALDSAKAQIIKYLDERTPKVIKELSFEAEMAAQTAFGAGVTVTTEDIENGFIVKANGKEVCFLEFGAGTKTDERHPFANKVPFDVVPGSWSKEHAKTYQQWLKDGKQGDYRYDRTPRRGMYEAYKAILNTVDKYAKGHYEEW